jgi:prenyltransferase beta subunit
LSAFIPSISYAESIPTRSDLDELYDARVDDAILAGLNFLISQQNDDGTFRTAEQGRWVGVCSLVGLALLSRGVRSGVGPAGIALRKTAQYVLSQVQGSGFLSALSHTSHGPMYDHGFGTLFLAEMLGTDDELDIRPKLVSAVRLIRDTQNPQGGWRYNPAPEDADLSVTVCQMMALRAARNAGLGVPKQTIDQAVDYVRRCQNPDGGFMYQVRGGESRFPLTAAAIVALYSAGIYEGEEIDAAVNYLSSNLAGNNSLERNNFFFYAHYYSIQAFWLRGGPQWDGWYKSLKRILLGLRGARGGWFDYNSTEYGTAMACLILNMPRNLLPIFQR